jgi:hypothetical protein
VFDAVLPVTVKAAVWRAYAVLTVVTSVPLASSAGSLVKSARYHAVGRVAEPAVRSQFRTSVSAVLEKLMIDL